MGSPVVPDGVFTTMRNQLGEGFESFERVSKEYKVLLARTVHLGSMIEYHTSLRVVVEARQTERMTANVTQ